MGAKYGTALMVESLQQLGISPKVAQESVEVVKSRAGHGTSYVGTPPGEVEPGLRQPDDSGQTKPGKTEGKKKTEDDKDPVGPEGDPPNPEQGGDPATIAKAESKKIRTEARELAKRISNALAENANVKKNRGANKAFFAKFMESISRADPVSELIEGMTGRSRLFESLVRATNSLADIEEVMVSGFAKLHEEVDFPPGFGMGSYSLLAKGSKTRLGLLEGVLKFMEDVKDSQLTAKQEEKVRAAIESVGREQLHALKAFTDIMAASGSPMKMEGFGPDKKGDEGDDDEGDEPPTDKEKPDLDIGLDDEPSEEPPSDEEPPEKEPSDEEPPSSKKPTGECGDAGGPPERKRAGDLVKEYKALMRRKAELECDLKEDGLMPTDIVGDDGSYKPLATAPKGESITTRTVPRKRS